MHEEPIDLTPLHPARDPARWEAMVSGITARALPALAAGSAGRTPLLLLAEWARPTLAAAAVVVLASLAVFASVREEQAETIPPQLMAEALDIPHPVADWIVEERAPNDSDLILVLEGESP